MLVQQRSVRRRILASAAALLLGGTLVGCGSGSKDDAGGPTSAAPPSRSPGAVLNEAEATKALLTLDDVGHGMVVENTPPNGSTPPGCLRAVDDITNKNGAPTTVRAAYVSANDSSFPRVTARVASYASVADAKAAVAKFRTATRGCTSVTGTDPKTFSGSLSVSESDDLTATGADQQVALTATGTISNGTNESPFLFGFAIVRIGNDLTMVTAGDLTVESALDQPALIDAAAHRLAAVARGDAP